MQFGLLDYDCYCYGDDLFTYAKLYTVAYSMYSMQVSNMGDK